LGQDKLPRRHRGTEAAWAVFLQGLRAHHSL